MEGVVSPGARDGHIRATTSGPTAAQQLGAATTDVGGVRTGRGDTEIGSGIIRRVHWCDEEASCRTVGRADDQVGMITRATLLSWMRDWTATTLVVLLLLLWTAVEGLRVRA